MGKLTISMAIFNSNVKLPEDILWYVGEIFADSNDSTTQVKTSRYFNTNAQESDEWVHGGNITCIQAIDNHVEE